MKDIPVMKVTKKMKDWGEAIGLGSADPSKPRPKNITEEDLKSGKKLPPDNGE